MRAPFSRRVGAPENGPPRYGTNTNPPATRWPGCFLLRRSHLMARARTVAVCFSISIRRDAIAALAFAFAFSVIIALALALLLVLMLVGAGWCSAMVAAVRISVESCRESGDDWSSVSKSISTAAKGAALALASGSAAAISAARQQHESACGAWFRFPAHEAADSAHVIQFTDTYKIEESQKRKRKNSPKCGRGPCCCWSSVVLALIW